MASSQLGLFVTAGGIAAAEVSGSSTARPRLETCLYEPRAATPDHDPLSRVAAKLAGRRTSAINVLDPAGYRLLLVEAPDVPAPELRAAVRWRIKDLIDFHVDDAVIDVFEMPSHGRGGSHKMMYAVTAKAEFVRQQIDSIENAGFKLDVIDIPELALRNVATRLEAEDRGAALLYLADRRSTLLLVRGGVLYLARHVDTGMTSLVEANVSRRELVAGLALEVRRSLDYFESHYEQTSIPHVFTSGLDDEDRRGLAEDLGVAVRAVELARVLDTDEALSPALEHLCLPAIGAALRHDAVTL